MRRKKQARTGLLKLPEMVSAIKKLGAVAATFKKDSAGKKQCHTAVLTFGVSPSSEVSMSFYSNWYLNRI